VWAGQGSEAAELVERHQAGVVCGPDPEQASQAIARLSRDAERFAQASRDRFDRRRQAGWLAERLEELVCS